MRIAVDARLLSAPRAGSAHPAAGHRASRVPCTDSPIPVLLHRLSFSAQARHDARLMGRADLLPVAAVQQLGRALLAA